jgi:hypothetical protein
MTYDLPSLLDAARTAFAKGDLVFPLVFDSLDAQDWTPEQVRLGRALVGPEEDKDLLVEYCEERGYPPEAGAEPEIGAGELRRLAAWLEPLDVACVAAGLAPVRPTEFWLHSEITGWCAWNSEYEVAQLAEDIAVLTVRGLGDPYLSYPVPICLINRSRGLCAVAAALGCVHTGWVEGDHGKISSSSSAEELFRVFVAADGTDPDPWETDLATLAARCSGGEAKLSRCRAELEQHSPPEPLPLLIAEERGEDVALDRLSGLMICLSCFELHGELRNRSGAHVHQRCGCKGHEPDTWSGYDFNREVELCYCCGKVVLNSGSRWSVWFCRDCKDRARAFNSRLGRYTIPIGRHSFHGGLQLDGNATEVDVAAFAENWRRVSSTMERLHAWSAEVVRRAIALVEQAPSGDQPLLSYLGSTSAASSEKQRCFHEMLEFLQDASV